MGSQYPCPLQSALVRHLTQPSIVRSQRGDVIGQWESDVHRTHCPLDVLQTVPGARLTQSWSAPQRKQIPRVWLQSGALAGQTPPSAHEGTHWRLAGSQMSSAGQSTSLPHRTQRCRAASQRGSPICMHWLSSTHARH